MGFSYSVSLSDLAGLGSAEDGLVVTDMNAALADWSRYVGGLGTLSVQVDIAPGLRANGDPTAVVLDGTLPDGASLVQTSSAWELATGTHVPGTSSDITINIDPSYLTQMLWLNPDPGDGAAVPGTLVDAVSVFTHEIEHGLGMVGYYQNGTLTDGGAYETAFDRDIQFGPDGTASFTGAAAEAVYGGPVPLTTDSLTENDYHFANSLADPLAGDLMNGVAFVEARPTRFRSSMSRC